MSEPKKYIQNSTAEFLVFTAGKGVDDVYCLYEGETIWLTQKILCELFDVSKSTVSEHFTNLYAAGEISKEATVRNFRTVQLEGKREVERNLEYHNLEYHNLDAIISIGYRVNSTRATQFRQWATQILKDYAIRGYIIDRERMENGSFLGEDYFEALLEEIREIRLSERRFYQKVTDIYITTLDYNREAPTTRDFFATTQNKLHGHTAGELIHERADSIQQKMGFTTFKRCTRWQGPQVRCQNSKKLFEKRRARISWAYRKRLPRTC